MRFSADSFQFAGFETCTKRSISCSRCAPSDLFISNFFDQIKQSACVHIVFDIDPIVVPAKRLETCFRS